MPGKALAEIDGRPVLEVIVDQARAIKGLHEVVLATSQRNIDNPLENFAQELGLNIYRGELENVARRFYRAAQHASGDYALRLNGDSPFLPKKLIELGISSVADGGLDLVTNIFPRSFPYGLSVEMINVATMSRVIEEIRGGDREHVTKHFYRHHERFKIKNLQSESTWPIDMRFTIDTPEDLEFIRKVVELSSSSAFSSDINELVNAGQVISGITRAPGSKNDEI